MLRSLYLASARDLALRTKLDEHLAVLRRVGLLAHAAEVLGGDIADAAFAAALAEADLVLLLLSADFVADAELWERRLPLVLARHEEGLAEVVPVLARPVAELRGTALGALAALPEDGRAVESWDPSDEGWAAVAAGVRLVAERAARRQAAHGRPVPRGCVLLSFGAAERRRAQALFDHLREQQVPAFLHDRDRPSQGRLAASGANGDPADPALDAADAARLLVLLGGEDPEVWKRPELARARNRLGEAVLPLSAGDAAALAAQVRGRWLALGDEPRPAAPPAPERSPFRPLQPFVTEDRDLFFGRDVAAADLADRVRAQRLVVLHGASGTGKTSLMQAGLRPILEAEFLWLQASPGLDLDEAVHAAVARERGVAEPGPAAAAVRALARAAGRRLLLVVDQAEELFLGRGPSELTSVARRAAELITLCTQAGDADLRVLLCLRNDYLGHLHLLREAGLPSVFAHEQLLLPLDAGASRAAIVQPLSRLGLALPRAVAQQMVSDLSDEGQQVNPVELQVVCEALYQEVQRAGGTLGEALYRDKLGGAGKVLATYLRRVLDDLPECERGMARVLLRALLHADGTRRPAQAAAELAAWAGLAGDAAGEVIEALVRQRLLRSSAEGEAGPAVYRIAHDLLARELYEQLSEEEKRDLALGERLRQLARTWAEGGRGRLLSYVPPSLREDLFGWRQRHQREMIGDAEAFLRALRRYHEGARRARVIGPVAAGLLVAGISWVAYANYRGRVEEQARTAETKAEAALEQDPSQALAWIAEAARLRGGILKEPERSYDEHWLVAREAWERGIGWVVAEAGQEVRKVAFSPGGDPNCAGCWPQRRLLAYASKDGTVGLLDLEQGGAPRLLPERHRSGTTDLAFSPDGQWLASCGIDGAVRIWALRQQGQQIQWEQIHKFVDDTVEFAKLRFSPDGETLAAGSVGGGIFLLTTGSRKVRKLEGHRSEVMALAFSPDSQLLGSVSSNGQVQLSEAAGSDSRELPAGITLGQDLRFSPDGEWLWIAGGGGLRRFRRPFQSLEPAAQLVSQGTTITFDMSSSGRPVWGDQDGAVWHNQPEAPATSHQGPVLHVEFSPSGNSLLSSGDDGRIKLRHYSGQWARTLAGHQGRVASATFSPDGLLVASGDVRGRVRLWSVQAGRSQLHKAESPIWSVTTVAPGPWVVAGLQDGRAAVWAEGDFEPRYLGKVGPPVRAVCALPEGHVMTAGDDQKLRRWRLVDGMQEQELSAPEPVVSLLCPSAGQDRMLSGHSRSILTWSGETGTPLDQHARIVTALALGGDSSMLFSTSLDGTVNAWDLRHQCEAQPPLRLQEELTSIALGPGGEVLFGGRGARVHRWNPQTGALSTLDPPLGGTIAGLATTIDHELLAVAAEDGLRLSWPRSGASRPLRGHLGVVSVVHFPPTGQSLYSGGIDTSVRAWPLPPRDRAGFQRWLEARTPFVIRGDQAFPKPLPPITTEFTGPPPRLRPACEATCRQAAQEGALRQGRILRDCLLTCER